jgi:hypothetical protein
MTLGDETSPPAASSDIPPGSGADARPASLIQPAPAVPPRAASRKSVHEPETHARDKAAADRHAAPERQVRALDPDQLIGLSPEGVQKLMGAPSRVKDDHLSREWVYSAPGCNFRVFFYPNLNAAAFHVLKYGGTDNNGGALVASNACVRRILTARTNAAD